MRAYIKKIWKALPSAWHEQLLSAFCRVRLTKRVHKATHVEDVLPFYIVGCFQAGGGLSRSAQLYASELRRKGQVVICVDSTNIALQTVKNPINDDSICSIAEVQKELGPGTVILHHNPPQAQVVLCALGSQFLKNKYIKAYWAWELEDIPPLWKDALQYVDALEVPSSFTQQAMLKNTNKPVTVLPHQLPIPQKVKNTYVKNGKLSCLFVMDMGSLRLRKNPEAVIEAFTKSFSSEEASLTIKLGQTKAFQEDYALILAAAQGHKHVQILTHWMDDAALEELYLEHDVYISLHRSEGYGLTIQEAMLRNLCIVATGWSGNMDFMQGDKTFPVPYTLVPIEKTGTAIDRVENGRWAEADIGAAVTILQDIRKKLLFNA